ncbi:hypothetical protein BGT96224_A21245 [Blumeria graminis f. sp. tritici 96224]|uniref:WH2 domain-containing protein n=1 Tax=Blumeria graminis f. sp. tritici 96224 TaxID=1268274 RepID=A0A656KL24_BLUGR|nr:hypothetical protein BGT96224_A21245 [Blumeria graminis f. sp. tritici 96224]
MPLPPPPPPPPPGNLPPRPAVGNRNALLTDITKGKQLKKATTNDRSAPIVAKAQNTLANNSLAPAPPVPGVPRAPAPPVLDGNQAQSVRNKEGRSSGGFLGAGNTTSIGGLFAGGIPKLKKRNGGVDTGATNEPTVIPSSEPSYTAAQKFLPVTAPKQPSGPPPIPGTQNGTKSRFFAQSVESSRKAESNYLPQPTSVAPSKAPPPPVGKKPPAPPPVSRKQSRAQISNSISSAPPPAPPPPLPSATPRPLASVLRTSPLSSQTSLPPTTAINQNLAMQAAIRAAEQASPSIATQPPVHASLKLTSDNSFVPGPSAEIETDKESNNKSFNSRRIIINDSRWKFTDDSMLPKPRQFQGGPKKYRAGRGSSVPLDINAFL